MLSKAEDWLNKSFGNEIFTPGLDRVRNAISALELSFASSKIITIAGTNGKGETIRSLAYLLSKKSLNYTLWTSPHLISIEERFVSNDKQISDDELTSLFLEVKSKLDSHSIFLSYYEFLFVCFLKWSKEVKTEFLLLEVGLGGRLDAVNALDAGYVGLTSISRDHQEYLGNRLNEILIEKLGVVRRDSVFISNLSSSYLVDIAKTKFPQMENIYSSKLNFSQLNQALARRLHFEVTREHTEELIPDFADQAKRLSLSQNWDYYSSHNVDGIRNLFLLLQSRNYNKQYKCMYLSFSERDLDDLKSMLKIVLNNKHAFEKVRLVPVDFGHKSLSTEKWNEL